jgi:hypothetical protein
VLILRTECEKDLGDIFDSKLYFRQYLSHISSEALPILGLIHFITDTFSSVDSLKVFYVARLEYTLVACNKIALVADNKLENVQRNLQAYIAVDLISLVFLATML